MFSWSFSNASVALSHFLPFPRMLWGLPTGRPSIFSPGGAVEVSSVAQALPDVSRAILNDSDPKHLLWCAVCCSKKQASKQWIWMNLIEDFSGFSQRMMKAEIVFRSKFCWVPMRTPRAIWSARAPGGSLWVASVSSCHAPGATRNLYWLFLFYKDMDVSKNRGKTPKMDGL